MKLYVDTGSKHVTVSRESVEKTEQNGRQKQERGTGRLMWSTQVFVLDDDGGEVITVTTAGEKPNVKVGQPVSLSKLEALPWATNGRNGVAFRAEEIKAAGVASAKPSSARWSSSRCEMPGTGRDRQSDGLLDPHDESAWRSVQIRAGQMVLALDMTECGDVARQLQ